ncbi:TPR repeat-containing thioredoxin TDX-like [Salvia hispanica]|uniref:TPR repeat-containing thioredoxin TDX-like n=1 Tax=Salvia hispanica TaxID=49212 RepID=UPI002008F4E3|nr:TPR repeat-containing thioredoxin TDX-like [Salvia hispanica]
MQSKDDEDNEDIKPFDSRKRDTPMDDISDDEIVESDVELDNSGVVEPDNDPPQKMGDPSVEVTEENKKAAYLFKAKAIEASVDGKFSEAVDYLTEAIMLNPISPVYYGRRATVFLGLKKPNAAIRDADVALEINPHGEVEYRIRGLAKAMLGLWEEAARDFHVASTLDFDAYKQVERNVKKIEEHNRKYERLRKEKELRRIKRLRKTRRVAEDASVSNDGEIAPSHSDSELEEEPRTRNFFFLKVDIDEAREVVAEWNISSIPTFFFVRNGEEVDHQLVTVDKNVLEQKIAQHAGLILIS